MASRGSERARYTPNKPSEGRWAHVRLYPERGQRKQFPRRKQPIFDRVPWTVKVLFALGIGGFGLSMGAKVGEAIGAARDIQAFIPRAGEGAAEPTGSMGGIMYEGDMSFLNQSYTEEEFALLSYEQRSVYAAEHFNRYTSQRRSFEPVVVFPQSVRDWEPHIVRAIAEWNNSHGLAPDSDYAPTVDEMLFIVTVETCGAAVESPSGARYPAGIMEKWFPSVRIDPSNRGEDIKAAVDYHGQNLRAEMNASSMIETVLMALRHYNGGPLHRGKPESDVYELLARDWLTRGQAFVDERTPYSFCNEALSNSAFVAWQSTITP